MSGWQAVENFGWQAARFGTKQQYVAFAEGNFIGAGRAFGGQRENAAAFKGLEAVFEILMYRQFGKLVIIQTARFILDESRGKPSGLTKCKSAPVLAHRRMILPVLGGISGWYKTMVNI